MPGPTSPSRKLFFISLGALLAFSLAIFAGAARAETGGLEKRWKVQSIGKTTGKHLGFIKFDNSYIEGQSTCNSYSGVYDLKEDQKIIIHRIAVTQLICQIDNKMELEQAFINGLESANSYKIEQDELILFNKDNAEIARFK